MANTRSAQKRNRQMIKRRARNQGVRGTVKTALKKAREALTKGDKKAATEAVSLATRTLNKAATKGVLHARNAQRRISRMAQALVAKK